LLGDPKVTQGYDHVIFDTAPTGHTLRLLTLPKAWTGFFDSNTSGASCLGPLAGLQKQRSVYAATVAALADANQTKLVLVSRPQLSALREAERTSGELAALGIKNQLLILNGRFRAVDSNDPVATAFQTRGDFAVQEMTAFLQRVDAVEVPLSASNVLGLDALRNLFTANTRHREHLFVSLTSQLPGELGSLTDLVNELVAESDHGVIMTMGKGGVGKTTMAAAVATALAMRGYRVHLSTTDPAAHIVGALGDASGVTVSRIDPAVETARYVEHVLDTTGRTLDKQSRALLEEDLRSPCTEEIAVFRAFARLVAKGRDEFVVLDTAPTGHTLLLLDATESYHREVAKRSSDLPEEVRELLPRLREPNYTRVLIVTLPEATPVHEAAALQADLRRAGIEPYAWIVNQSLRRSGTADPILRARAQNELRYIEEVVHDHAPKAVLVPWVPDEPVGAERLREFFDQNLQHEEVTK
jgi:arsenite-transporting ATPase